jgi:NhaP-type Na+/H+ or K+/H+ antiporter
VNVAIGFLVVGLVLVGFSFATSVLERLRIPVPAVYLLVGLALGPAGVGFLSWDLVHEADLFERLTEIAVVVSLFTVGLNIRRSPTDPGWLVPVRLATVTMVLTIAALAFVGVAWLGLSLGAAVLLGAILAPTDPVLATEVQLRGATDRNELRHALSGEAGLNDGAAFPFVMLGLGLLALHPDAEGGLGGLWADQPFTLLGWAWWDLLWAVGVGLAIGGAVGWLVGHGTLVLQRKRGITIGLHEFLVLGLIALAYGLAELVYAYGFLAVFAAGYALRYIELRAADHSPHPARVPSAPAREKVADSDELQEPQKAAQFLAASLLDFNDKLEHLLLAAVMVLVGGVLVAEHWSTDTLWLAPLLFIVIRPAAVAIGLARGSTGPVPVALMGWFGVRGIGSLYYLTYAIEHGLSDPLGQRLTGIVLSLIVVSVVVHGISVVPLMRWYERHEESTGAPPGAG